MKSPLRDVTEGALEGIRELDLGKLEPEALVVVLTAIGDALRLGVPLPTEVSRGLRSTLSERDVLVAIDALTASVDAWSLPAALAPEEPDPGVEWALRRRDEVESVLVAARRVLLPRGILVDASQQVIRLNSAVSAHDLSCDGKLARSRAELMLGDRLELVDEGSWLDRVKWPDEETAASDAEGRPMPNVSDEVAPDLDVLEAYVVEGRFRAWVEAWAERSAELAATLERMIATYRDERAAVGLVARRWEKRPRKDEPAPATGRVVVDLEPPRAEGRRAAADDAGLPPEPEVKHRLGLLDPLDAEADVRITAREIALEVYADETPIREVRLGEVCATPPKQGGIWTATVERDVSRPSQTFEIVVTDSIGRTFQTLIAVRLPPS